MQKTQNIKKFTQSILKESHQLVLQKIDQAHVAVALAHVNKLETMLVDQCRTPYQFEMQAQYFLKAIKAIEDLFGEMFENLHEHGIVGDKTFDILREYKYVPQKTIHEAMRKYQDHVLEAEEEMAHLVRMRARDKPP